MTPISDVFMLSIEDKLDYDTLRKICLTGHSRVPVYEEVTIRAATLGEIPPDCVVKDGMVTVKKIIGILLVKNCVLLDPNGVYQNIIFNLLGPYITNLYSCESYLDAVPIRKIPLNKVLFVPSNEPLLGILDKFQEGRSHIAVVGRHSKDKAVSVKKAVKMGLTQRIRATVGIADSDSSDDDDETASGEETLKSDAESGHEGSHHTTKHRGSWRRKKSKRARKGDLEMGMIKGSQVPGSEDIKDGQTTPKGGLQFGINGREQAMPADAVLTKEGAKEVCRLILVTRSRFDVMDLSSMVHLIPLLCPLVSSLSRTSWKVRFTAISVLFLFTYLSNQN
jgi:metal transporter CNNM